MPDFLFRGSLRDIDPDVYELTQLEAERQYRKLILIASESAAPAAVREAHGQHLPKHLRRGLPRRRNAPHVRRPRSSTTTPAWPTSAATATRATTRAWSMPTSSRPWPAAAAPSCSPPTALAPTRSTSTSRRLSGAPANNAVYHALVSPGDTVMGMNLLYGGHLTHGSPVNRSGKLYQHRALHHRPGHPEHRHGRGGAAGQGAQAQDDHRRLLVLPLGGRFQALPPDRRQRRRLPAGRHGPRGRADRRRRLSQPGGHRPRGHLHHPQDPQRPARRLHPHHRPGPGAARSTGPCSPASRAARTSTSSPRCRRPSSWPPRPSSRRCRPRPSEQRALRRADWQAHGFTIPFGGTESHLFNVDCKIVAGADGTPLMGDMAARILDLAGIVLNRNTIPGDTSAANPSGLRIGTPWVTQRGFKEPRDRRAGRRHGPGAQGLPAVQVSRPQGRPVPRPGGLRRLPRREAQSARPGRRSRHRLRAQPRTATPTSITSTTRPPTAAAPYIQIQLAGERAADFLYWATTSGRLRPGSQAACGQVRLHTPARPGRRHARSGLEAPDRAATGPARASS